MSEQSNEEIRVKVAEVLGWTKIREIEPGLWIWTGPDGHPYGQAALSQWPTSMDAALTLCDRLRLKGWTPNITCCVVTGKWTCEFTMEDAKRQPVNHWGIDASLPLAICEAFLKAHPSP